MEIDLTRLPLPDWDLNCPSCRYPLRGLPSHRCPECGTDLDIPALVRPWTRVRDPRFTGRELPFPDFGLRCEHCHSLLAGASQFACPACQRAFDPAQLRPRAAWFALHPALHAGIASPLVEMTLAREFIPHLVVDQKGLLEIYMGSRALGSRVLVASEFFFEFLWHIRRTQAQLAENQRLGPRASWTCPACHEAVPGNFDICWNCEAERPRSQAAR